MLALGATLLIRGTFAANINLNDLAPVEFGQGVALATSCTGGSVLTVTPHSSFVNSNGGGEFKFTSVTVEDIPSDCYNKQFKITAYSNSRGSALELFDSNATEVIVNNYAGVYSTNLTGLSVETISNSQFTATFDAPVASASDVEMLTIESSDAPEVLTVGSFAITDSSSGVTASPEIAISVAGTYTVEGWYKFTEAPSANALLARSDGLSFFINAELDTLRLQEWGDNWENGPTFSVTGITLNNWVHIAISRNLTGDTSVWINGTKMGTSIDLVNYQFLPNIFPGGSGAGGTFIGRISNIRVTDNAVYDPTSTFISVPTAPLEVISGTKLLLPAYTFDLNRDLSADSRSISTNGVAALDSPF